MPVINILSPHVADMIAAGEVVERPASVIKELMENAFDAGAKNIKVEIRSGGATYIRVTDDGCGMAPEDAGVAFLRHATSKLKDERGLEAISTMGFRGEALAAISSVSHIELITRKKGDKTGTRLTLDAGDIQDMVQTGCPEGTSITIRDLFFNTPARLKFLKSDRSESGACITAALRCALARPDVSVRFIRDGREEFFSPGDGRQDSCIYSLLGRDLSSTLLPCKSAEEGLKLSGFVSSPSAGRGNRGAQYFFINGRWIKSAVIQSALEQAYKNTLLSSRFPAGVLYLELSFAGVDVNVHPAKTEVKFSSEKAVFDLVYYAVRASLENENAAVKPELSPNEKTAPKPREDFYQRMSAESFRENGYKPNSSVPVHSPSPASEKVFHTPSPSYSPAAVYKSPQNHSTSSVYVPSPVYPKPKAPLESSFRSPSVPQQSYTESVLTQTKLPENQISGFYTKPSTGPVENYVQSVESLQNSQFRIVGEALKTYIIVEKGQELVLIDKHAAHERMIFDRLKKNTGEIMAQNLLVPVTLKLNPSDAELLDKNAALLSELGFGIEPFGENDYIVRTLPYNIAPSDTEAAIEEICEKLRRGTAPAAESARDEILHTVACKAAIKAGWDTDEKELQILAEAVISGQIKYCPHGRPLSVSLSKYELDKLFKRIV